ncbi:MAG TPA: aminoglycoside phosphotransferase family protein [Longimicrobiaceae bacterium]|nr:aminoglycoside phosphotransferase family protein [Longimicrobiaceae bacterium]
MTLVDPDGEQIREMVAPVLGGAAIREVARVDGGLVNAVYRVTPDTGDVVLALRVAAPGAAGLEAERRLLARLAPVLPVPEVLWADVTGECCGHPYLVYRWIEGVTLNACRRSAPPAEFLSLAEPLGGLLARVAGVRDPEGIPGEGIPRGGVGLREAGAEIVRARSSLRTGAARARLGEAIADRFEALLDRYEGVLCSLDATRGLVHGDLGGRNVLVAPAGHGAWRVSGLLDWESATVGGALWDVGSLFRYSRRYAPTFLAQFARGYRAAGGELPGDWWLIARLLDATRVVSILDEPRPLPGVFAECRELIDALLVDYATLVT